MPNPKMGTVTKEVIKAVKAAKQGSVQYKVDKTGIIHAGLGKISFTNEALMENMKAFMLSIGDQKPENYKGKYIETVHICSTMGPGIPIEVASVDPSSPKFFIDPALLKLK
jgi:large subunit ribosomal protein L1